MDRKEAQEKFDRAIAADTTEQCALLFQALCRALIAQLPEPATGDRAEVIAALRTMSEYFNREPSKHMSRHALAAAEMLSCITDDWIPAASVLASIKQCRDGICAGGLSENRQSECQVVEPYLDSLEDEIRAISQGYSKGRKK